MHAALRSPGAGALLLAVLTGAMACGPGAGAVSGAGAVASGAPSSPGPDPSRWVLIWSDEFHGNAGAAPDPQKWTPQIGDGSEDSLPGWGNRERQYYTAEPENLALDGRGHLAITARELEAGRFRCYYGPCRYTSARINTRGTFEVRHGRIEARIQLPRGQGIWPAFWMLGANIDQLGWPACGEIDVMENIGREAATVYGTIHGPGYSGARGIGGSYTLPGARAFADAFHVFAVEWEPGEIRWYVDETHYFTVTSADIPQGTPWVFDRPFFLILNVAVGGQWPGYPDDTTTFPQTMLVDYVRVYAARDSEGE